MKVMGLEFEGSNTNYVLIQLSDDGGVEVLQANRLVLAETRSRDALIAFHNAVSTLFNSTKPELIGIKSKPEAGQMRAGAAALKMEGIVLTASPCSVDFVSAARINKCTPSATVRYVYLQAALKAAQAALTRRLA